MNWKNAHELCVPKEKNTTFYFSVTISLEPKKPREGSDPKCQLLLEQTLPEALEF